MNYLLNKNFFLTLIIYIHFRAEPRMESSLGHSPSLIPIVSTSEVLLSDPNNKPHNLTLKDLKRKYLKLHYLYHSMYKS